MDEEEDVLSGRRTRRRLLVLLGFVPVLAAIGFGVWYFLDQRKHAENTALVDQITGAAFGCVATVRGDAPDVWSLERALEHMSYMERLTRDESDPTIRDERERFDALASDAARGCEELGTLMMRAQRERRDLYFGVPAVLAHPPDQNDPERWYRRVLPERRQNAEELTRQIRAMAIEINARRAEYALMPQELPVDGRGPTELARIIEIAPVPRDRERATTEVWPTPDRIVVLRRGSIGRVPCDTRFINRASCFNEFVQWIDWDGTAQAQFALERPDAVLYWSAFAAGNDGSIWAVGKNPDDLGVVGRYPPEATTPELAPLPEEAVVDATTNIVIVTGGIAVFPQDGSAWVASDDGSMDFQPTETTPPPLVLRTRHGGAGRGIEDEMLGRLSITGTTEDGFTSRSHSAEEESDVLLRMIDAGSRVEDIADLRALRSGRAVALLRRNEEAPDAIAITSDFGRSWLAARSSEN